MDEKGDGDSVQDIVAGRATDYVTTLSTDADSLSDSDPDPDTGLAEYPEGNTLSTEEEGAEPHLLGGLQPHSVLSSRQKTPVQPFHLKGMSSTFNMRSQSIFDSLEGTAKPANKTVSFKNTVPEWNFKLPLSPGLSIRSPGSVTAQQARLKSSVPDYVAHPERWTKYSLEEVAECSDRTNSLVAENFIEDIRRRKVAEKIPIPPVGFTPAFNQDTSSSGAGRILFAKPIKSESHKKSYDEGQKDQKKSKPVLELEVTKIATEWGEDEEEELEKESPGNLKMKLEDSKELDVSGADSAPDKGSSLDLGFHGNKKRIKKNIRSRLSFTEGEDSP
ncbi:U5 small nuclear ribonucleoprotein TSSC4 [Lissotriton helveticus]